MLLSITGPSGVGKGYLKRQILQVLPSFSELIWLTTRPLRPDEIEGVSNRKHISFEDLSTLKARGMLVHEQFLFGNWYALTVEELARRHSADCMTETHIDMLSAMQAVAPHVVTLALVPKTIGLLEDRLIRRDGLLDEAVRLRLEAAPKEIERIREKTSDFSLVIEVSRETESSLVHTVLHYLSRRLTQGEQL